MSSVKHDVWDPPRTSVWAAVDAVDEMIPADERAWLVEVGNFVGKPVSVQRRIEGGYRAFIWPRVRIPGNLGSRWGDDPTGAYVWRH